jgi:hypothetical protein
MTCWIEQQDEPADGTMNGAVAVARTMAARLWTAAMVQLWMVATAQLWMVATA